jgi:hypothetical protein
MTLNFNQAPYYDDFQDTKGFLKILFRPGYAVQARELTQSQDILQNQIGRFGSFVFQSGSPVLGGQITMDTNVVYANVNPLYQNNAINLAQFANSVITDAATRTVRATVVATVPQLAGSVNPPTLMLKYLTGTTFANGANITVESSTTGPFALLAANNSQGIGSMASIQDGIYYLDLSNLTPTSNANANVAVTNINAYFVRVPQQSIVLDAYDNTPSYRVGLQISDAIVTEQTDSSLLDPALGSTNYQAPGAARYIINATLSSRQLLSTDDTAFISLLTVANGQLLAITTNPSLAALGSVLAKRTYDQSGSFTVKPFIIKLQDSANNDLANANSQQYYVSINPGSAYVEGYNYQTISKTFLSAPRARTIANVASASIQTYFGNYLYVDTMNGELNFTTLPLLDIHCVPSQSISSTTYANTKIGTARLRGLEYNSAANTANGLNYVFRASLVSINTTPISSNVASANNNPPNITFGSLFSPTDNAYAGMTINLQPSGDNRLITSYNGAQKTAYVSSALSNTSPTNFTILSNINSAESLGLNTFSSFVTANCNVNIGSKNQSNTYQYVALGDPNFQSLIFPFPNQVIAQGLQSPSYQYRTRVATGQTLTPGTPVVVNLSISGDPSATFVTETDSGSDLLTLSDFLCVTNPGGGVAGVVVPMVASLNRSVTSTPTTATFTFQAGNPTFTNVDIYASINTNIGAKTKTLVTANNQVQSGGTVTGPATVYVSAGQILFATPATSSLMTPGVAQSLFIADAIGVAAIVDTGSLATSPTTAMIQAALAGTAMPGSSINVTNNYKLFNGQKDAFYDHATLTLNSGAPVAQGQLLVLLNYYQPSTTGGYFSVDSYPNYATIPSYTSTTSVTYNLRDCIDFRPVRDAASTATTFANAGLILLPEPTPTSNFQIGYGYYLPRFDLLTLDSGGNFNIIQGSSGTNPQVPATPSHNMLLYTLAVPAFTFYAANVNITMQNNKRYTMHDIFKLEKRIQTLEYYNALNAVEQQAINQTNPDSNGNDRPQNGLLVDSFVGTSVADVLNPDYAASIDGTTQLLRPSFNLGNFPLTFNPALSSGFAQNDNIITLPYSIINFISQNAASRVENLNPFNLSVWNGTLDIDPSSDTWMDTVAAPSVTTNLSGDNDSWQASSVPFATVWNNWQTVWTGVAQSTASSVQDFASVLNGVTASTQDGAIGAYGQSVVTSTTTTTTQGQVQTGIQYSLSNEQTTVPVGTNIINTSIIPYIRNQYLLFIATGMKPLTNVYPFFDNVNVRNYTNPSRLITFTTPVQFISSLNGGLGEQIIDQDGGTNGGLGPNSAYIHLSSGGNQAWIGAEKGIILPGKTFKGVTSGATGVVASYAHNSGDTYEPLGEHYRSLPFTAGVTPAVNANSIVLQATANNTNGYYVGNSIYVFAATGSIIGVSSTITAYNGASRIATVSPNWNLNVPPNTSVFYSIGNLQTDTNGSIAAGFAIPQPAVTGIKLPTGTATLMMCDQPTGQVAAATTKAQASYTAQGTLETTQQEFITTEVPVITTQSVQQSQVIVNSQTNQTVSSQILGYFDPLAQSFYVDNNIYPNGVFITSIRVCFASKDNNIPVTLQLRPMVNGYPSSSTIIPFSQVTLTPNMVTTSITPNLDNPATYTEFFFSAPINLQPGYEYAIVMISNSNNYNVYSAAVGDTYLGSTRIVSAPPYMGVLFKSQNSSTWTPSQGESLMFRVTKAQFNTTNPLIATFNNPTFDANNAYTRSISNSEIYMDVMYITNNDQKMSAATLNYAFRGTANTGRSLDSGYTTVIPNTNYFFNNRYVATPAGNTFFLQSTGTSTSQDVSPIIDTQRYSVIGVGNIINVGGIQNTNITILNGGVGYNIANTNIINVTGGGGGGAQLQIGSVNANGTITSIIVSPGGSGSGYFSTPNTAVIASGYTPTQNASFVISGESNPSGGNIVARYMTRMATLAPGQDASDINVYIDANIPQNTNIFVYYKIMSRADTDTFTNKPWVPMSLVGTQVNSNSPNVYPENRYVGSLDSFGNPINHVSYGGYNSFAYFAVKIDMVSNNPTVVPTMQNLRIYCLPSG